MSIRKGHTMTIQIPQYFFWVLAIAGAVGFVAGSAPSYVPVHRGFRPRRDMAAGLVHAAIFAAILGGLALLPRLIRLDQGAVEGVLGVGLFLSGDALAVYYAGRSAAPRVPRNCDLQTGINRGQGASYLAKYLDVKRLYTFASFHGGWQNSQSNVNYFATRSPLDYHCGDEGMSPELLARLKKGIEAARYDTFAILLLLVRELPGEPDAPAVIVVRGLDELRRLEIDTNGIAVPGVGIVPARTITDNTAYAWR
jgi:hypothetical protein